MSNDPTKQAAGNANDTGPGGGKVVAATTGRLTAAICAVMADVGPVVGTGQNTFDKYTYASGDDILEPCQAALARAGVAIYPLGLAEPIAHDMIGRKGDTRRAIIRVRYLVAHKSGEALELEITAEGADRNDKAISKAWTNALKILLKQLFVLATVDEPRPSNAAGPQANRQPTKIDLEQPVIPGSDGGTWRDLTWRDHLDWLQKAAAGKLEGDQLYVNPDWMAHAAVALKLVHGKRRAAKRIAQVRAHLKTDNFFEVASWIRDELTTGRRNTLAQVPTDALAYEQELRQDDLTQLKTALQADGADVASEVPGMESRAQTTAGADEASA